MTPKEKAVDLIKQFKGFSCPKCFGIESNLITAKQCAEIAVDEIIKSTPLEPTDIEWDDCGATHKYWYETKKEESLKFWLTVKIEVQSF